MKSFEKEIRRRKLLMVLFAVGGGMVPGMAGLVFSLNPPQGGVFQESWPAVLIGVFAGVEVVAVTRILYYSRALNNPEFLETLAIKEHDEMNRMITLKTCKMFVYCLFLLLGLATVVAGFFSRTAYLTLGFTTIGALVLYLALRVYFFKRF